jgi:hypothetical protein
MIARIVAVALVSISPTVAWAMGADHGTRPVGNSGWPKGLAEIVNADGRVHGYFVNWQDVFFFHGDTQALNEFLEDLTALKGTQLKVVIHPGRLEVKSPWDKQPRKITAEWQLYTSPHVGSPKTLVEKREPFVTRVDVYLGGDMRLSDLRIPASVGVESGGEIEEFVKRHQER